MASFDNGMSGIFAGLSHTGASAASAGALLSDGKGAVSWFAEAGAGREVPSGSFGDTWSSAVCILLVSLCLRGAAEDVQLDSEIKSL